MGGDAPCKSVAVRRPWWLRPRERRDVDADVSGIRGIHGEVMSDE